MKKLLLPLLTLFFLVGFTAPTLNRITGIVISNIDGLPLAGADIKSLPGGKKTVTDKNGKFSIQLSKDDAAIEISSLGFEKQVVKIGTQSTLRITLREDVKLLDEIVVVGYGVTAKKEIVGSVSTISSETLAGKVAGVSPSTKAKGGVKSVDKSGDDRLGLKTSNSNLQSNQLTAGEWNDLTNWKFWKELMRNQDWNAKQKYWGFDTKNRIKVTLVGKHDQPLIGYQIAITNEGKSLWNARSNYAGIAELWPTFYADASGEFTVEVSSPNGKMLYKKRIAAQSNELNISLREKAEPIKNLDVMFMVDATGSMGDEIAYLKAELEDIVGRFNTEDGLNTRTGMVFYRDRGDEYITRGFDFEKDIKKVKQHLSHQYAGGGGDFEEAVDEAMENAIFQQRWTTEKNSAKIMFLILDAPPHHDPEKIKSIQKSVQGAAAKGIILIPVVASGIDKNTEFLMRFMALGTNGTYVFLTDDSGIGNSHLKPTVGKYQVEYLNQLLYRLTRKYAGLNVNVAKDLLTIVKERKSK